MEQHKILYIMPIVSFMLSQQVFGKLISGDAEPTPEQEEKALLSSPEGEEKVHNVFIFYHYDSKTNNVHSDLDFFMSDHIPIKQFNSSLPAFSKMLL